MQDTQVSALDIDLHGYHPNDIVGEALATIVRQTRECGEPTVLFIHGHARNRGISPGFINTNTGYFGLKIGGALRHNQELRTWIKHATLVCHRPGATSVKLKRDLAPIRIEMDPLPNPSFNL
jgi:hypothetical protein